MVLVDTSVWVDHFRSRRSDFSDILSNGSVLIHPCVSGELACGMLKQRSNILGHLAELPVATLATDLEVLHLIEEKRLWGRGIGWVDANLLASALLSHCQFWTLDKRLATTAQIIGLAGWTCV